MNAWSRERVMRLLRLALPVSAAVVVPAEGASLEPDRVRTLRSGDTLGKALRELGFDRDEA